MFVTNWATPAESPDYDDSDEADEMELDDTDSSYSSLSSAASRRGSSQSAVGRHIKEEPDLEIYQVGGEMFKPTISSALVSGRTDPFQTLPDLAGGDTERLAHHWQTVFVNTTTPPGPRKRWFSFGIADPVLFHGMMHIAAAHIAASQRVKPSLAYFQHRGEVIRLVNKRISYDHNATNDGTISGIAMLLISDSMSGHPERARAHISGIEQLTSARGGIEELNPLTQRLVRWAALLASITFQERPLFCPRQMTDPDLQSYYGPASSSTASYSIALFTRLLNYTGQHDLSQLAANIFWGLRNLSVLKETANRGESLSYESTSYSDRLELLERQTEDLLHDTLDSYQSEYALKKPRPILIFILFAHAVLIYVNSTLRDLVPSFITGMLAHRLELGMDLDDSELNILLGTFPELMLWILFTGGGAARPKSKLWFAKTASKILRLQKQEEMAGITNASTSFLWPEGRENYDDSTGEDFDMTGPSEVEVAFASLLPSAIARREDELHSD